MEMRAVSAAIGVGLVLALATAGFAQVAAVPQEPAAQPATAQTAEAQEQDVFDLIKRLLHKIPAASAKAEQWDYRKLIVAIMPSVGYKPSTGFTIGASGNIAVFFGDPKTTHISSAVMGLSVSSKKQTSINLKFLASGPNDRVRFEGDNRFQWTSQDTYGLGMTDSQTDVVNAKFTHIRVFETALYELREGFYGGVGIHFASHSKIRPGEGADASWDTSPYAAYSREHGFAPDAQTSTGVSVNLLADTRDSPINASRGWLASLSYRPFFKDVFGSDSAWQEVLVDVRTYVKLRKDGRRKLAFWGYGDVVADGIAPYFDLPALGMDTYGRSGRGYSEGRFRGERLMYGEMEYRATLSRNGLLGMVVFANVTTVANRHAGEKLFDDVAPAGGAGLRVLFSKRSKTNLCIDYAWGRGSKGLYLALQEAF
jgi:outer membrane protein assembly factor BamA